MISINNVRFVMIVQLLRGKLIRYVCYYFFFCYIWNCLCFINTKAFFRKIIFVINSSTKDFDKSSRAAQKNYCIGNFPLNITVPV